jgi:dGTPase
MASRRFPIEKWTERRSGGSLDRAKSEWRSEYSRDQARVIHSAGFRRLQAKTQVLGIGEGDFHRTRLTHSLEAAQIGRGIVDALQHNWLAKSKVPGRELWATWLPDISSISAIALAHDIGHPPFGHGGEIALNYSMRGHGGFEGNGQTLRLLARLEAHTDGFGLDLTRRSLLGILKYPVPYEKVVRRLLPKGDVSAHINRDFWIPPKSYMSSENAVVRWILEPFTKEDRDYFVELEDSPSKTEHGRSKCHSLDTGIMELADDIAYGVHDLEDAIALKLVQRDELASAFHGMDKKWAQSVGLKPPDMLISLLLSKSGASRKQAIGALVNAFIVSIQPSQHGQFSHPLLKLQVRMEGAAAATLRKLKRLILKRVIETPQVQTLEYRGQRLIVELFAAIASDPERFLKDSFKERWRKQANDALSVRVICDYISGMTDEYATKMYERMFVPRQGHVFDRL